MARNEDRLAEIATEIDDARHVLEHEERTPLSDRLLASILANASKELAQLAQDFVRS